MLTFSQALLGLMCDSSTHGEILETYDVENLLEQSAFAESDSEDSTAELEFSNIEKSVLTPDEIIIQLRRDIKNLKSLSTTLDHPVQDVFYEDVYPHPVQSPLALHHNFSERIQAKFPKAPFDLVNHLGKVTYETCEYLLSVRSGVLKLGEPLREPEILPKSAPSQRSGNDDSGYASAPSNFAPIANNPQDSLVDHINSDVASIPGPFPFSRASSVATSNLSLFSVSSRSKIPKLPEEGKLGLAFDCVACDRQVEVKDKKAWK